MLKFNPERMFELLQVVLRSTYGKLRFSMPGLYMAVNNYIKIYRTDAEGKDFVFVNARGGKADTRPGNEWMKIILSGELNAEEKRNLTLDCWSAAWTQWKVEEKQGSKKRWIHSLTGKSNSIEVITRIDHNLNVKYVN